MPHESLHIAQALLLLITGSAIDDITLYLGHVGDCRAVLCRGSTAVRLTQVAISMYLLYIDR